MTASPELTAALRERVKLLEDDLRERVDALPEIRAAWTEEHANALVAKRTSAAWETWRDERVTQAGVAWVLTTVFVRFCEDNQLVKPVWIGGPESRLQDALDGQLEYFRQHPTQTDREWLEQPIAYLAKLPATKALVDEHSPLHLVSPSGDAAAALLAFWRKRDDDERLVHDLTDPDLSTRFLGDLYQDLSEAARDKYALLQTPEFVEEFILDQTLEPALRDRPFKEFKLIDPTCGSGHFLLGAFARLMDRLHRTAPGLETRARVQEALDCIHGVDINPFAVAIARFRLTIAALQACGELDLENAPGYKYHLAVGDSLLHGSSGELDFGAEFTTEALLTGHAYSTEDLHTLREILEPGRYDVVVGNPPYITVRDRALNAIYRQRYPASCHGQYHLSAPFTQRFFDLAKRGGRSGWAGIISDNGFMKREYGKKFVERFLSKQDLRLVVDTSGAFIPGHGTPTVIMVGRKRQPTTSTVRAVLGIRGEPGRPTNPTQGIVWRSIVEHVNEPGHDDGWTNTTDLERSVLDRHPWSLTGGAAVRVRMAIDAGTRRRFSETGSDAGFMAVTREDDAYIHGLPTLLRRELDEGLIKQILAGDDLRDWSEARRNYALCTYDPTGTPRIDAPAMRLLWPLKQLLLIRRALSGTQIEQGLEWWEYSQLNKARYAAKRLIAFAFVATHNHFVLGQEEELFIRSAPVIMLPKGSTADDHLELLGVLNSSTACFWLKQNSHDKGNRGGERSTARYAWESFYEFTGTTLQDFPLPAELPLERGRVLDRLARELGDQAPSAVCGDRKSVV